MTKAVTGAAAMQLVEQGRIGLDQPMGDVLPVIQDVKVLDGFDAEARRNFAIPEAPVTLRHLLTHTSGYGYDIFNTDIGRYIQIAGLPSIVSLQERLAARCRCCSIRATNWEYGIGIDLAGKVVEAVSGESLEAYFRGTFSSRSACATRASCCATTWPAAWSAPMSRGADGKPAPISFEFPQDADFHMGGGGLFSTAPDYLAFTRMLLAGGTLDGVRVLKPETVKLDGAQRHRRY